MPLPDGAAGLKYFVSTIPMIRTTNVCFDINLEPQAHDFEADEPEEVGKGTFVGH